MAYCNFCNLRLDPNDANHIDGKCPYSVTCSETHTHTYYCFVCKETNVSHTVNNCPNKCKLCSGFHTTEMHPNICKNVIFEKGPRKRFGKNRARVKVKC